jgi:hypothetical protein
MDRHHQQAGKQQGASHVEGDQGRSRQAGEEIQHASILATSSRASLRGRSRAVRKWGPLWHFPGGLWGPGPGNQAAAGNKKPTAGGEWVFICLTKNRGLEGLCPLKTVGTNRIPKAAN